MRLNFTRFISIFCFSALFAALACPDTITITDIGPALGGDSTVAGINTGGQVAGTTLNGTGLSSVGNAFVYSTGVTTNLGTLGGRSATATGLNNSGQIVGNTDLSGLGITGFVYSTGSTAYLPASFLPTGINDSGAMAGSAIFSGSNATHAAVYSNGTLTDLGTLGGTFVNSQATAINNAGQVVGNTSALNGSNPAAAFLYSNGVMTNIGSVNNLPWSTATAISNNGEIVGYSAQGDFSGPGTEAFAWINGKLTALGTGSGTGSEAFGVNDKGEVVGSYYTPTAFSYTSTAFVYANGALIDLNSLLPANSPWDLTEAIGINDAGQIVGLGYLNGNTGQGQNQVFLLDLESSLVGPSTPEPDSLVLLVLGLGLGAIGFRARRHRSH